MKQLSIALTLVFAVACKTDAASQSNAAPGGTAPGGDGTIGKPRSAKIDVKPIPPALPTASASNDQPGDNDSRESYEAWRKRREEWRLRQEEWRKRRDAELDTNHDGVVSDEEREAPMRANAANMRTRIDADHDGKLTPAELANARWLHFDDPAALDTNHDGDISADELAAAFKARRDQWRARANQGNAGQNAGQGNAGQNAGQGNAGQNASQGNAGQNASQGNAGQNASQGNAGQNTSQDNAGQNASQGNAGQSAGQNAL